MTDNLRDRITDVLADEFKRQGYACEWAVLADAVIRELDYEERVTSAIQGYAQSEMVALSYHDPLCHETAYAAMRRLDTEARQIARYSMTYRKADDE
jgi:hypothetical protein